MLDVNRKIMLKEMLARLVTLVDKHQHRLRIEKMKKTVILPNSSSAGLFKELIITNKKEIKKGYKEESVDILSFEPDLINDPIIKTQKIDCFFIERDKFRITHSDEFRSIKKLNNDKLSNDILTSIVYSLQENKEIDIWFDQTKHSQVVLIFLLSLISQHKEYQTQKLTIFRYCGVISSKSIDSFSKQKIETINKSDNLILKSLSIWNAMISKDPSILHEIFEVESKNNDWIYYLIKEMLDAIPEKKTGLNKTERDLLSIIDSSCSISFLELSSKFSSTNDQTVSWLELPSFLDKMKDLSLIEYTPPYQEAELKKLVEDEILTSKRNYYNLKIILTTNGKNVKLGINESLIELKEKLIKEHKKNQKTFWLWDCESNKIIKL